MTRRRAAVQKQLVAAMRKVWGGGGFWLLPESNDIDERCHVCKLAFQPGDGVIWYIDAHDRERCAHFYCVPDDVEVCGFHRH